MGKNFNIFKYWPMFHISLTDGKKLPENDLRKIKTCKCVDGLYMKIYIILTYSAFVGII